jgi:hypothetical protein
MEAPRFLLYCNTFFLFFEVLYEKINHLGYFAPTWQSNSLILALQDSFV